MQKQTKTKKIFYLVAIILSLLICYLAVAYWQHFFPFEKQNTTSTQIRTNDPTQTTTEQHNNSENNQQDETTKPNSGAEVTDKTPIQHEGEDPNNFSNLTGFVSNKNVTNGQLVIRLTIDQFLHNNGTCELILTNQAGKKVSKTAPTLDNPSSATCQGFDVPISELAPGKWSILIDIKADNKSGTINGGEIEI